MEEAESGRPLREIERKTLEALLSVDFDGAAELRDQIPLARAAESRTAGSPPSFDIAVPPNAPRSILLKKMAPITALAFDPSQEYTGEFILWLADGYLSSLEYAWVTGEAPKDLPALPANAPLYATGSFMEAAIDFYRRVSIQRRSSIQSYPRFASDQIPICEVSAAASASDSTPPS
jgi:hypothetical protein